VVDCSADDNLIIRCYRQMAAKYASIGPVHIRFKKNIPFGAGLGGGSSDAAHMAIALNELFSLGLTKAQLASEVRSLGADCPFFIYNTPCYASGIGDELLPIELDMRGLRILMVKPDEGVSTNEAYGGIIRHPEVANAIIEKVETTSNLKELLTSYPSIFINDFEQTVFPLHPSIESIKKRLLDANALYACMSGSGSTVFGLFEDDSEGRSDSQLRMLEQEFASMILLNDTFG
jgi:4-diphosphocytidyl-2-C-methyl-D-erythritol kinase